MNTPQEHHGEHEREEGLGRRVRRFVDSELGRIRDKENRGAGTHTDNPGDPDPADRGGAVRTHESASARETPVRGTPARETPARETPARETPARGAPAQETPAEGTPAQETPAQETPAEGTPAQETQRAHEPAQERYSDPVRPNVGGPGYADRPATAAPHDAGREPGLRSTRPEESRGRADDQLAAEGTAARVGLLNDIASLRYEWQQVQGTFVDDPQRAVHEASVLIDRTLDEIRANVGSEHPSETMSTEDLRVSFQRYREFFQRLLSA